MIDVPWNGFSQSKKIADLAEACQLNVAPHNYYSHLSTLMSAHLCACIPNVRIMEIDIDDVPWKDDLITRPLDIQDGYLNIPDQPGWGADLNEAVAQSLDRFQYVGKIHWSSGVNHTTDPDASCLGLLRGFYQLLHHRRSREEMS